MSERCAMDDAADAAVPALPGMEPPDVNGWFLNVARRLAALEKENCELRAALAAKADAEAVPTKQQVDQLQREIKSKTDHEDVPSNEQFHQLCATVARKADADGVPTSELVHEILAALETKSRSEGHTF
ncbi:unnamed protein product [Polarella glacialis]|uniref:Uncharacterized protein n=1 Tax=Polarella glacialis TaxID=89957 RepID=A0A813CZS0_POLGL|nr:unnamed protein product [Polarella glacialis]